jgi:predicted nucleic acid-binding protein
MRIVVSDSSCLIDLRKASLLDALVRLPYELLIPNTLFEDELLKFTTVQKSALLRGGLQVIDLPGDRVTRAVDVTREIPRLSIHDGFAFALAEQHEGCVLLSGDGALRTYAAACAIEVRGVLWIIDELHRHEILPVAALLNALALFAADATVRLPAREVAAYIRRYEALHQP